MLCSEVIAICFEYITTPTNAFCKHNIKFLNVNYGDT
jgi:hypothetical protein